MARTVDARAREPREVVGELRRPGGFLSEEIRAAAGRIVEDVRERGDAALLDYTERFDGVRLRDIRVPEAEIDRATESLSSDLRDSLWVAIENVRAFHEREIDRSWKRSRASQS